MKTSFNKAEVHLDEDGNPCCRECFELGSQKRFVSKVTLFVHSLDEAKLLYVKMFDPDGVEGFLTELRESANYQRRHRAIYESSMALDVAKLHHHIRCVWSGRMGQAMTPSLELFIAQYVQPCLDTEPGFPVRQFHLQKVLEYMENVDGVSRHDIKMVETIVTGKVQKHPALQGLLVACLTRLQGLENGATTFRNRHSHWVALIFLGNGRFGSLSLGIRTYL